MWPFKRKPTPPDEPYIPPRLVERYFIKEWDYENICDLYILIEVKEYTPHVLEQKMFLGAPIGPSRHVNGKPAPLPSRVAAGDLAWAQATARKLGFKLTIRET